MKNKILSVIMVATMAISLVACGTSTKEVATTPSPSEEVETTEVVEVETPTVLETDGVAIDGDIGTATSVSVKDVSLSDYESLDSYLADKTTGSVAYDITIADADGNAVQPAGSVNVTVDTSAITAEGSDYVVYYADAEGIFEKMNVVSSTDSSVTFTTTHFSVYVVSKYNSEAVTETDFASTSADVEADASESTEVAESSETETTESVETAPKTPTYTYTDTSATMYAKSSVNVRSGPSTDFDKLGGLSTNDEVTVTGKCNETGWYRIEYKGSTAYVSDSYLVSEKVNVAPPAETPSNGGGNGSQSSGGNWYDSYVKNQWIDMTNCFIYINTTGVYVNHDDNVKNTLLARFPGSIVNYWTIRTYKDGTQVWAYMYTYGDPMDSTSYSTPSIP